MLLTSFLCFLLFSFLYLYLSLSPPYLFSLCSRKEPKMFTFDQSFFSLDSEDSRFSSQEKVFDALGQDLLENAFQGYNACIFAYGQTGEFFFLRSFFMTF